MPKTYNEEFFDAMVRHQIGLTRLSGSIRNDIFRILDATEEDMVKQIEAKLAKSKGLITRADLNRRNALFKALKKTRLKAMNDVNATWVKEMMNLAKAEPAFVGAALNASVPVVWDTTMPSTSLLKSIVNSRPFEGKLLKGWANELAATDLKRISDQVNIGLVQGEGTKAIARRIVGTAQLKGVDGVTQITRRAAEAITRTAVNHVSNEARREFFVENKGIVKKERYVATLDSRTTIVCSGLDGKVFPIDDGPRPPLHMQCRSIRVGAVTDEAIGKRPARAFTERQLLREFTSKNKLPGVTTRGALPRGTKGKYDTFSKSRMRELTGTVPAKMSYQKWLEGQPAAFQDDILGKSKGALFRKGKVPLDRFVNKAGDELTLAELAVKEKSAFALAGLDK